MRDTSILEDIFDTLQRQEQGGREKIEQEQCAKKRGNKTR